MHNPSILPFRPSTLRGLIDRMALECPDSVYLSSPESGLEWTFEELRRQSIRLGRKLHELGVRASEKVAFMAENGVFTSGLFLGTMYAGFVSVPLNVRAGRSQLAYMLDHSDAKVVFVSTEYETLLDEVKREVSRDLLVIRVDVDHGPDWEEAAASGFGFPEVRPDTASLLIYTSGSTGQPKGALHTHRSFIAGGWNSAIPHKLSSADRTLCVLPLYHLNAESVSLLATLLTGGSVVMPHQFLVRHFWEWIAEYRCTWSALVPTIISQLLEWGDPRAEGKGECSNGSGSCVPPRHRWRHPCTEHSRKSSGFCSLKRWARPNAVGTHSPTRFPPEKTRSARPAVRSALKPASSVRRERRCPPERRGRFFFAGRAS